MAASSPKVKVDSYCVQVIRLLKDPSLKPSELSKIDIKRLSEQQASALEELSVELVAMKPLSRSIGFMIYLKRNNPDFASKFAQILYSKSQDNDIKDSLKKLFPHLQTAIEPIIIEPISQTSRTLEGNKENQKCANTEDIVISSETKDPLEAMKSLLDHLLELAYSDEDIGANIYQELRELAIQMGPSAAYEQFVRQELWPRFPTNLDSKFSQIAFRALMQLLHTLQDIFPPQVQQMINQKFSLIEMQE